MNGEIGEDSELIYEWTCLHHDIISASGGPGDCRSTIGDGLVVASSPNRRLAMLWLRSRRYANPRVFRKDYIRTNERKYGSSQFYIFLFFVMLRLERHGTSRGRLRILLVAE